jgi:hypothetical protein
VSNGIGPILTPGVSLPLTQKRRLDDQFKFQPRTPIFDTLNRLVSAIELRLQPMEITFTKLDDELDTIENVALQRMNEVFTPLIIEAQKRLEEFGANFSAHSATSLVVGTGEKILTLDEDDRAGYVYADYLVLRAVAAPSNYMIGHVVNYDREAGQLIVSSEVISGSGTFASWDIHLGAPPDTGHASRTDNPHATTAAQVGAYTTAQADAATAATASSIVSLLRGNAPAAYDTFEDVAAWIVSANTQLPAITTRVRVDGPQTFTANEQKTGRANISCAPVDAVLSHRNLLINGSLRSAVWRTPTGFGCPARTEFYFCDQWACKNDTNTIPIAVNIVRSPYGTFGGIGGCENYMQLQCSAGGAIGANDQVYFSQPIEGHRIAELAWGTPFARPLTIGFRAWASTPGTMAVVVTNNVDRHYIVPVGINNQPAFYKIVIPGDTVGPMAKWNQTGTINTAMKIKFCFGSGTNKQFTPNVWYTGGSVPAGAAGATNFFTQPNWGVFMSMIAVLPFDETPGEDKWMLTLRTQAEDEELARRYLTGWDTISGVISYQAGSLAYMHPEGVVWPMMRAGGSYNFTFNNPSPYGIFMYATNGGQSFYWSQLASISGGGGPFAHGNIVLQRNDGGWFDYLLPVTYSYLGIDARLPL